jgi:mannopine transport system ATP-binding protein
VVPSNSNRTHQVSGSSITFDNISKSYGALKAVDDVSLTIEAGEFIALLGPSGSGKTTLLMLLAGFETPSSGQMRIGGRDVTFVPPNKRNIGMVFQRYALFPHLTVAQNIAFPLRMRNMPKADIGRHVERILSLVQLDGLQARLPHQLSGGQQQRVAVGRALVFNPSVLLMDEPLGALDKKLREQMQIEIKHLHRSLGVTVIYVTHDQDEALTMSDRVSVIHQGRLVQIGSPMELYLRPKDAFVADFVGKMNFIDAVVAGERDGGRVLKVGADADVLVASAATLTLPAGRQVRVAVRPEQLSLARPDQAPPHALRGTLETIVFVGSLQMFLVRVAGALLHVHMLAGAAAGMFREGDDVLVAYDPAGLRIFGA